MQAATGKSILNGIAIGKIRIRKTPEARISTAPAAEPESEIRRFDEAVKKTIGLQHELFDKAFASAGRESAEIFRVHAMILQSGRLTEAVHRAITLEKRCAEYAVKQIFDSQVQELARLEDPCMKTRSSDIRDIEQSLLRALHGIHGIDPAAPQNTEPFILSEDDFTPSEPFILAGDDFTPSETIRLDRSLLLGMITREGSCHSHTSILTRSMNLPSLIQCKDVSDDWDGRMAVLDGYNSCVYIDPTREMIEACIARQKEDERGKALLFQLKGEPDTTIDGTSVRVYANIGGLSDLEAVQINDADGIGLFRSEFLYLNRKDYPSEEEQFEAYRRAVQTFSPRRVVIRTFDIGADKKADYMDLEPEENPALGFRAVRICLTREDFFKTQLRALLRASAYGSLAIMFPMIISLHELERCRLLLEECRHELAMEGKKTGEPDIGIMVETPAAVLCADELAQACDFFSIGTSDLAQYICAIDRRNARLEPFFNAHHPALLRAVRMTVDAGHRHGIRVGICGELGADISLTETFLRMGVDELSVNPGDILPLRRKIRSLDLRLAPGAGQTEKTGSF